MSDVSELIKDLRTLPEIVGNLGLSIARAQKAFDVNYLEGIRMLIRELGWAKKNLADGADQDKLEGAISVLLRVLEQLAPSRYQFTETEITFNADLATRTDKTVAGSLGVGLGAVTVSASAALAFGSDYRAAATVRSVIHAMPSSEGLMRDLLGRVDKEFPALPNRTTVDKEQTKQVIGLLKDLMEDTTAVPDDPDTD